MFWRARRQLLTFTSSVAFCDSWLRDAFICGADRCAVRSRTRGCGPPLACRRHFCTRCSRCFNPALASGYFFSPSDFPPCLYFAHFLAFVWIAKTKQRGFAHFLFCIGRFWLTAWAVYISWCSIPSDEWIWSHLRFYRKTIFGRTLK